MGRGSRDDTPGLVRTEPTLSKRPVEIVPGRRIRHPRMGRPALPVAHLPMRWVRLDGLPNVDHRARRQPPRRRVDRRSRPETEGPLNAPHPRPRSGFIRSAKCRRCTPWPHAMPGRDLRVRYALVSSEPRSDAVGARATRRNSLLLRPIRRVWRGVCHRAVIGSNQTPDDDWPSMSSSSKFVASPGPPSLHQPADMISF